MVNQEAIKDLKIFLNDKELHRLLESVNSKCCFLHEFRNKNNKYLGVAVFFTEEHHDNSKELYIQYLVGHSANFIKSIEKFFVDLCKQNNISSIRCHSSINGMGRLLKRVGFDDVETVYRRIID